MGIAQKLALACAPVLAAIAFSTSTASATAVEVRYEGTGAHCSPCVIHAVGQFDVAVLGMLTSRCDSELEFELHEHASGHIYTFFTSDPPGTSSCTLDKCNGIGEAPSEAEFPIGVAEETALGVVSFPLTVCFDNEANPNGTGTHCQFQGPLAGFGEDEHVGFGTTQSNSAGPHDNLQLVMNFSCGMVSVNGTWNFETEGEHDAIEIIHL